MAIKTIISPGTKLTVARVPSEPRNRIRATPASATTTLISWTGLISSRPKHHAIKNTFTGVAAIISPMLIAVVVTAAAYTGPLQTNMPQKPATATIPMRGESTDHFPLITRTANGVSPNATIIQRKNASENAGISPAFARATMLFVESMQATTTKPIIASTADECIDAVPDLL